MKWNWLRRLIGWLQEKFLGSGDRKYKHWHEKSGKYPAGNDTYKLKAEDGPHDAIWWNEALNSREQILRCIVGFVADNPMPTATKTPGRTFAFESYSGDNAEIPKARKRRRRKKRHASSAVLYNQPSLPRRSLSDKGEKEQSDLSRIKREPSEEFDQVFSRGPDLRRKDKKNETETKASRQTGIEVPPGRLAANRLPSSPPSDKHRDLREKLNAFAKENASGSDFHHDEIKKSFTAEEYFQLLDEQRKKYGNYETINIEMPWLPPRFVNAVDMLIAQMNLSRNEFRERSILDVKIYDRIRRRENWQPKADTCKAILFALQPSVLTAIQLYQLAGYTFLMCAEDELLLAMFGIGDYDIEKYNKVMSLRGLKQLGSKSQK